MKRDLRWAKGLLALMTGAVSAWILFVTVQRDYWDYYMFPKLKAADGYIYPQLRYTIFDVVLILWCIDGLVACAFLAHRAWTRRTVDGWSYRTTVVFFTGVGVLVIGVVFGTFLRSRGF